VPAPVALPEVEGRKLSSVRFRHDTVELDFAGYRLSTAGTLVVATGSARLSNADTGWRDALCSVIGSRAHRVRHAAGDRFEIQFDDGTAVLMPHTSGTSTDDSFRRAHES
jgi:hypothetical protein